MKGKITFWGVATLTAVVVVLFGTAIINVADLKIAQAATESISLIREDCTGYSNCYTSLKLWEDDFGGLPNGDLVTQDKIAIAKIEGPWTNPDTSRHDVSYGFRIEGWTTGPNNYIKIYTAGEARHQGVWSNSYYRLIPAPSGNAVTINTNYVRIDGLQIQHDRPYAGEANTIFLSPFAGGDLGEIQLSNNIIRQGAFTDNIGSDVIETGYLVNVRNFVLKVWNNVITTTLPSTAGKALNISRDDWTAYLYNNTVVGAFAECISNNSSKSVYAKNNITQDCVDGFVGTFDASSDYNVSDIAADAPGANSKNSATVSFTNSAGYDFSLLSSDTVAQDNGTDLSSDSNISFAVDNRGYGRTAPWDIGAMEISTDIPPPPADTTPPILSNGSPSGTLAAGTISTTISVSTNENATCKYSATSGTAYASMTSFSTSGTTSHSSSVSGLTDSTSYIYYVKCQDTSSNTNTTDYTINFAVNNPAAPAPVTIASPVGGTFGSEQSVSLTSSDSTATIYYTLDGTTPTTASAVYLAPITISTTKTLKFFAKNTDNVNEAVKTEIYTIEIVAPDEVIGLIREDCTGYTNCFTSLRKWEDNYGGIDFGLCTPGDLVCANKVAIGKIEGSWTNLDTDMQGGTNGITINGWETGPNNYIKIYTSGAARHNGVWSDTAYILSPPVVKESVLYIGEPYVRIDGLQIKHTRPYPGASYAINAKPLDLPVGASAEIYISNNIIQQGANTTGSGSTGIGLGYGQNPHNFVAKVWNNIMYSTVPTSASGIYIRDDDWVSSYIYNNTAYGYLDCYKQTVGVFISKNNIAQNCTTGFNGTFDSSSSNNISSLADAPGVNSKNGVTVNFINATGYDFGLLGTDTIARNAGVDLSTDQNLKFADDVRGYGRYAPWDIGASEDSTLPPPDILAPEILYSAPSGTFPSDTTSTEISVTTDENATCKYGTTANTPYDNLLNTFSGSGTKSHTSTVSGFSPNSSYQYFSRCKDTAGNKNLIDYIISFSVSPVDTQAPTTPTGLSASIYSSTQIDLSWTASTDNIGVAGYKIYRNSVEVGTSQSTTYSDTGLSPNTTYAYVISAYDSNLNDSGQTSPVSATTPAIGTVITNIWAIGDDVKIYPDGNLENTTYTSYNTNYKSSNKTWSSTANTINIKGAKNETVAFQLAIKPTLGDLNNVNVSVSNLTNGSNTIASTSIELFKELYITTTQKSKRNHALPTGEYPDALLPLYPNPSWIKTDNGYTADNFAYFNIQMNKVQPVWVDVKIPTGTPAGTYTGTITVTADNQDTKTINLTVNVWNFEIPAKASIPLNYRIYRLYVNHVHYNNGGVDWYNNNDWDSTWTDGGGVERQGVMKKYFQMAHEHRAQATVAYTGPRTKLPDGNYDWSPFDTTYGQAMTGAAYDDGVPNTVWEIRPGGGTQGSHFYGDLPSNWQTICNGCSSWTGFTRTRPTQQQVDDTMFRFGQWADHFEQQGWMNQTLPFSYAHDEPTSRTYDSIEVYSQIANAGSGGRIDFMVTEQPHPFDPVNGFASVSQEKEYGPDLFTRAQAEIGETSPFYTNWTGQSTDWLNNQRNILDTITNGGSGVPIVMPSAKTKIDIYAPGAYYMVAEDNYLGDINTVRTAGKKHWFYQGGGEPAIGNVVIDAEQLGPRMWTWAAWKYDIDGIFYWVTNFWKVANDTNDYEKAYTDPKNYTNAGNVWNGGGVLFYPGEQRGLNGPVSSVRMKAFRKGMYDYEYMQKLKDLGDQGFADSTVNSIVEKALNNYVPNTTLTEEITEAQITGGTKIIKVASAQYFTDTNYSTLKIIGATPNQDEIVGVKIKNGTTITLFDNLQYPHAAGSIVAVMHTPYSYSGFGYTTDVKWSKNPVDWENARVAMADKIVCLQAGSCGIIDNTAPAAITNLSATSASDGTVTLSWTAPGDDGNDLGTWASSYTIKYSKTAIDIGNWSSITTTISAPTPKSQGNLESLVLSNLDPLTTYYFGIKATDDAGNESSLSNTPSATTQALVGDTTPPSNVDLVKTKVTKDEVILSWADSTDDVGVIGYEMRYKTGGTLIDDTNWNSATEVNGEPAPGQTLEMVFNQANGNQLIPGVNYSFGAKAYDLAGNYSSVSNINNIANVPVPQDSTPPSTIDDLSITDITETSVKLNWTAPGNDGNTGTAGKYIIATSSTAITSNNWDSLGKIDGVADGAPIPKQAGETQSKVIVGLKPNTSYYFAIRAEDMALNMSAISNVETVTTEEIYTVSSGSVSTGGGGGCSMCGSNTDMTPPSIPSKFKSMIDDIYVNLTWENPDDDDFIGIVIIRKEGSEPTSISDGDKIYTGEEESFTDKSVLKKETDYYYAIYSFDHKPNYSQPEKIIVNISKNKITAISDDTIELNTQPQDNLLEKQVTYNFPLLTGPFAVGMENSQVKLLQQMLATDPAIYPQGTISGYYGQLTIKAVQKFQEIYNIVFSGTPDTTGYGLAGPTTRKKMNEIFRIATFSGDSDFVTQTTSTTTANEIEKQKLTDQIKEQIKKLQLLLIEVLTKLSKLLTEMVAGVFFFFF